MQQPRDFLPRIRPSDNAMYYASPENKRQLTNDQIVQEIMTTTVGNIGKIFDPTGYKQPQTLLNANTTRT